MEKEVMDALCMLHDLAKEDTTYTTQDEQFNIVYKHIKKLQNEIKHQRQQRKYWRDNYYEQQKEIEKIKQGTYAYIDDNHNVVVSKDYISKDKIREVLKDLEEFDTTFFNASTLKEAIKNSLNDLLEEK